MTAIKGDFREADFLALQSATNEDSVNVADDDDIDQRRTRLASK